MAEAMSATLDPRAIEREIGMIRERESNPYSSGIKTNLFNLVILTGTAGERADSPAETAKEDGAAAALQHLLGRRPARIITIDRTTGMRNPGEQGVQAAVSGRCFPDTHSRGVCFEEIRISGGGGAGADIGAWAPLLIRDIPVYAWALGRATDESLASLRDAAEYIDKLIVDTSAGDAAEAGLEAMRALRAVRLAARRSVAVSDFAWLRTAGLRVQAARAFDPPEARARLAAIRKVSAQGLPPAEAALFLLWLASRLGWTPDGDRKASPRGLPAFVDPAGKTVLAGAQASDRGPGGPRRLMRIELGFDAGEPLILSASAPSDGEILLAEVDSLRQDPLLEDVLGLAEKTR